MRILSATVDLVWDGGAQAATVEHIVERAGVSRKTLYGLFEGRGGCLLAAIEHALALAGERASAAYDPNERWVDRVRAGLYTSLQFFDEEPKLARLCLVHSGAAGPAALARRLEVLDQLARVVDEGRHCARRQPPPRTAEIVVGGMFAVIHARLLQPDSGALVELVNPLMSMVAWLYLGGAAARRELSRRSPAPSARPAPAPRPTPSPLAGLGVRLTNRTLTVLDVVGAEPGLSNSEVSGRAGVSDQGQISKILRRLSGVGLLENTGGGQAAGAANAWRLTLRGEHLQQTITRKSLLARR